MRLSAAVNSWSIPYDLVAEFDAKEQYLVIPPLVMAEGQIITRRIAGTIKRRGPNWWEFLREVGSLSLPLETVEGILYKTTLRVQIDHDSYGHAKINVNGDSILLLVNESFSGSVDEYRADVAARNAVPQRILDLVSPGRTITLNDVREVSGLPRLGDPHLENPYPADQIDALQEVAERQAHKKRNLISPI